MRAWSFLIEVQDGLYRIAQEALNNALKHAKANQITLNLKGTLVQGHTGDHR